MSLSTLDRLASRFDGALLVDLIDLHGVLKSTPAALYQAYRRKAIPFAVRKVSGKLKVSLIDLAAWLDNPAIADADATSSNPKAEAPRSMRGRPSAAEKAQADKLGITVGELRRAVRSHVQLAGGAQ